MLLLRLSITVRIVSDLGIRLAVRFDLDLG